MAMQVLADFLRFCVLGRLRGTCRIGWRHRTHSSHKVTCTIYAMLFLTVILGAMVEQTTARMLQLPLHYRFSEHKHERSQPVRVRRDVVKVHLPPAETSYGSLMGKSGQGYYITVYIGTPPQKLNVLVDTGSSNFAVAAYPDPLLVDYFDSKNSSSLENLGTTVSVPYTQGNWTGPLVRDRVTLSILPNVSVPAQFAAISTSQGFFINDSNWQGILGLAYAKIARPDASVVPYFDSLLEWTDVEDVFSMQLCGTATGSLSMTGTMTIGGVDSSLYEGPLFTTPIFREWYYEVIITDMGVGGHSLNMDCKEYNFDKTIVDSGTTNLRLPMKVYTEVVSKIQRLVVLSAGPTSPSPLFWQGLDSLCWPRGEVPFYSFPPISMTLSHQHDQVFTLTLSSQQYLRPVSPPASSDEVDCFKFALSSSDSGTVLGAVVMEGFYTVFNRANHTIGFAKSRCNVKDPNSATSTIQGLFKYKGNSTQCAYMRPSRDEKPLVIVAYVMAAVCAVCILPLVALVIQLQVRRRCGDKRLRIRSDDSDVRPLHDD